MTTYRNFSNIAVATTLNGTITSGQTNLDVTADTGWPAVPFTMLIGTEVILVTARTGVDFSTIVRDYDGTTGAGHTDGDPCFHVAAGVDIGQASALVDDEGDERIVIETNGDITTYADNGSTVVMLYDESDSRTEFGTRPFSTTDAALLEIVGHTHGAAGAAFDELMLIGA